VLDNDIHFDHIIPWSKGGPTEEHSIRLLCDDCNRKRGASFEGEYFDSDALGLGVNLGVVSPSRNGHVRQAPVHELLSRSIHVDVHEHSVGGLSLAAVARDGVAVIQVGIGAEVEGHGSA
jgi:hypothetical protein